MIAMFRKFLFSQEGKKKDIQRKKFLKFKTILNIGSHKIQSIKLSRSKTIIKVEWYLITKRHRNWPQCI